MSTFNICQEQPDFAAERAKMRQVCPRDLASGTMRVALHLSEREYSELERLNPETLGIRDDMRLRDAYWKKFINSPESAPFRVGRKL